MILTHIPPSFPSSFTISHFASHYQCVAAQKLFEKEMHQAQAEKRPAVDQFPKRPKAPPADATSISVERQEALAAARAARKKGACVNWNISKCKNGSRCHYKHDRCINVECDQPGPYTSCKCNPDPKAPLSQMKIKFFGPPE